MRDADTCSEHQLVFVFWASSGSYVFKGGWIKEFAKRRGLAAGDEIGIYWDPNRSPANRQFIFASDFRVEFCNGGRITVYVLPLGLSSLAVLAISFVRSIVFWQVYRVPSDGLIPSRGCKKTHVLWWMTVEMGEAGRELGRGPKSSYGTWGTGAEHRLAFSCWGIFDKELLAEQGSGTSWFVEGQGVGDELFQGLELFLHVKLQASYCDDLLGYAFDGRFPIFFGGNLSILLRIRMNWSVHASLYTFFQLECNAFAIVFVGTSPNSSLVRLLNHPLGFIFT
ncbi:hypothetical protein NL676_009143 [Syzygium grande]|nr:hypothetical protein NL676_009143 [Syzygium grande]